MTVETQTAQAKSRETGDVYGVIAEFDNVDDFVAATRKVRDAGFEHWDTYTPFPVHGIEQAMGMKRTLLPFLVLAGGILGCLTGIVLQWWMNAHDYPLNVSGKPLWSIPANIPVIFELTVLFSAIGAVFGMLTLNKLPELHHPLFTSDRFLRVTTDRFFIGIEARDQKFDIRRTEAFLHSLDGNAVEIIREDDE